MYCPKCAAPIDGVKFCRQCGTNVSLVPQALTGQLPAPVPTDAPPQATGTNFGRLQHRRHARQSEGPPSMGHAFSKVIVGLGFLVAAAIVMRSASWGWAFLFPAFINFGAAVVEYYRVAEAQQQAKQQQLVPPPLPIQPATIQPQAHVPTTSELRLPAAVQDFAQPISVTEHTTALLDPERQKARESS